MDGFLHAALASSALFTNVFGKKTDKLLEVKSETKEGDNRNKN